MERQEFKKRKDLLGNIMAEEGLTIRVDPTAETARISVQTREIVIPDFAVDNEDVYDLFQAHEISHALHTPMDNPHEELNDPKRPGFFPFLNITEDARIERLIQDKFPGLKPVFTRGYRHLIDTNWFGDVSGNLSLIDRLNIQAKTNGMMPQAFDEDEQVFLDRLSSTETFEEAKKLAQDVYDFMKKKWEEEQERKRQEAEKLKADSEEENDEEDTTGDDGQGDDGGDTEADEFTGDLDGAEDNDTDVTGDGTDDEETEESEDEAFGGTGSAEGTDEEDESAEDADETVNGSGSDGGEDSEEDNDSEGSGAEEEESAENQDENPSDTQGGGAPDLDEDAEVDEEFNPEVSTEEAFRSKEAELAESTAEAYGDVLGTYNLEAPLYEMDVVVADWKSILDGIGGNENRDKIDVKDLLDAEYILS